MNLDLREIPAVYMNLKQHIEKNERMQNLLNGCGFKNIIRVEGIHLLDSPISGCAAAHYNGLCEINPPFILFEDDCVVKNFKSQIEVPDDIDALYLGVSSWGRMNSHSGPCVQHKRLSEYPEIVRIYNMLSAHAILYFNLDYVNLCKKISYLGYLTSDHHDIGFAEIQKYYNVYAFDDPMFYQTSSNGTDQPLSSYPTKEIINYEKQFWKPTILGE